MNVGSDPAKMETSVSDHGHYYVLNGEKLWCTNGTIADIIVVMARHEDDEKISAFIVEMDWEGVKVEQRCHFMGLRALENGLISFTNVRVPKENLIGERGKGLKLSLVTLNTGRLSLPAAIAGQMKKYLEIARLWSREREQWGRPIHQHEAIAHKIADLAANTLAMESISELATALYDQHHDIRLEAAVAKMVCSEVGWKEIDELLQIRGGRGYETAQSLKARGEQGIPIERMMRDFRINRIFEGTNEIMHLFIAREAIDQHLKISGVLLDREVSIWDKAKALPKIGLFYGLWYPGLWLVNPFSSSPEAYLRRSTKKLARSIFHAMVFNGPGLQNKQKTLFRFVDMAVEIYVMAATLSRSEMLKEKHPEVEELATLYFESAKLRLEGLFREASHNLDRAKFKMAKRVEDDDFVWMEEGIIRTSEETGQDFIYQHDTSVDNWSENLHH